jgi:hypothetical protein
MLDFFSGGDPMTDNTESKPFDRFELTAAVLLGLGAITASLAGHQESLWGGQSSDAYSEAAALTTKASATYNDELTTFMKDTQTDVRAKELIWEGSDAPGTAAGDRLMGMASWLLLSQMSDAGYQHLKLPEATRTIYRKGEELPLLENEELETALNTDLGEDYVKAVFSASHAEFERADQRFAAGRDANNRGDQFSLAGVVLSVALFFAGVSLVFKSSIRWAFLGFGALVLVGAFLYMLTLTWA